MLKFDVIQKAVSEVCNWKSYLAQLFSAGIQLEPPWPARLRAQHTAAAGNQGPRPQRLYPGRTPTYDGEHVLLDVCPDVYPSPALGVVRPAQAGDVHHAALVHVHHTGCGQRERDTQHPRHHCGGSRGVRRRRSGEELLSNGDVCEGF